MAANEVEILKPIIEIYFQDREKFDIDPLLQALKELNIKFTDLLDAMSPFMMKNNQDIRSTGWKLLDRVLKDFPKNRVTQVEATQFGIFLIYRFGEENYHSLPTILKTANSLCKIPKLPFVKIVEMVDALGKHSVVENMQPTDRKPFYDMVMYVASYRFKGVVYEALEVSRDQYNFVAGFVRIAANENDPRNLARVFTCSKTLAEGLFVGEAFCRGPEPNSALEPGELSPTSDLYELISGFFPLNQLDGVDASTLGMEPAMLQKFLSDAMVIPPFARFNLPFLLGKSMVKGPLREESLRVLNLGLPEYSRAVLREFLNTFWTISIDELTLGNSLSGERQALMAVTNYFGGLLKPPVQPEDVENDCREIFHGLQMRLMSPHWGQKVFVRKVLFAIGDVSTTVCGVVIERFMPTYLRLYESAPDNRNEDELLRGILALMMVTRNCSFQQDEAHPFADYYDECLSIMMTAMVHRVPIMRGHGVTGVVGLTLMDPLGSIADKEEVVCHIMACLIAEGVPDTRVEFEGALSFMAERHPELTITHVLKIMELCVKNEDLDLLTTFGPYRPTMTVDYIAGLLASVSRQQQIIEFSVPVFMEIAEHCCRVPASTLTAKRFIWTMQCLIQILDTNREAPRSFDRVADPMLGHIFSIVARASHVKPANKSVLNYDETMNSLASLVRAMFLVFKFEDTVHWSGQVLNIYMGLENDLITNQQTDRFLLSDERNEVQGRAIALLTASLGALKDQTCIRPCEVQWLYNSLKKILTEQAEREPERSTIVTAAKCLGHFMNKFETDVDMNQPTSPLYDILDVLKADVSVGVQTRALIGLVWLTKAAVNAGWNCLSVMLDHLMRLVGHPALGREACQGLQTLLERDEDVLNTAMHSKLSVFVPQRVFHYCFPRLVDKANTLDAAEKENYLNAITTVLVMVPYSVLRATTEVIPFLVKSLDMQLTGPAMVSLLERLAKIVLAGSDDIEPYAGDIIPRVLALGTSAANMEVRRYAFECLANMCSMKVEVLQPWKPRVVREIQKGLDDRKRLVRKAAGEASCAWHAL